MSRKIYTILRKQLKDRKELVKSRQMVKGVLADCLAGEKPIYTNLLMAAYDEDVVTAISKNDALNEQLLNNLQQRIISNHGLNEYCACWAITTWFLAFEKQIPQDMLHDLDDKKVMKQEGSIKEHEATNGLSKILGTILGSFSTSEPLDKKNVSVPKKAQEEEKKNIAKSTDASQTTKLVRELPVQQSSIPSQHATTPASIETLVDIKSQLQVIFNHNFGNVFTNSPFKNRNAFDAEEKRVDFLRRNADGYYENFSKYLGIDDTWLLTYYSKNDGPNLWKYYMSEEEIDDVKKQTILTSICKGKYSEEQIIHARVDVSLSFGWILTTDSICALGRSGKSYIVPYKNVEEFKPIIHKKCFCGGKIIEKATGHEEYGEKWLEVRCNKCSCGDSIREGYLEELWKQYLTYSMKYKKTLFLGFSSSEYLNFYDVGIPFDNDSRRPVSVSLKDFLQAARALFLQ